jgi:hypothetical protein
MVAEEESTVVRDLTNVFHSASLPINPKLS